MTGIETIAKRLREIEGESFACDGDVHEDEGECVVERIYRQNGDTLLDLDVCGASWNTANVKPAEVTHRKPDTLESIFSEMVSAIESEDLVDLAPYVERYRKLKGGE